MKFKDGKPVMNREEYKAIRKLDRNDLESVLSEAYRMGRENGFVDCRVSQVKTKVTAESVAIKAAEETLIDFKGIGPARKESFLTIFKEKLRKYEVVSKNAAE